jgi:hypothetical protein
MNVGVGISVDHLSRTLHTHTHNLTLSLCLQNFLPSTSITNRRGGGNGARMEASEDS